jgi:hypothetical protein
MTSPVAGSPGSSRKRLIIGYLTVRAATGCIGTVLLAALFIGNTVDRSGPLIPGWISGYYYTHFRNPPGGAFLATAVFLAAYRSGALTRAGAHETRHFTVRKLGAAKEPPSSSRRRR